jgi:hypothetical protein
MDTWERTESTQTRHPETALLDSLAIEKLFHQQLRVGRAEPGVHFSRLGWVGELVHPQLAIDMPNDKERVG